MKEEFLLKKIAKLLNVGIVCDDGKKLRSFSDSPEYNPVFSSEKFRENLKKETLQQKEPYLYRDNFSVYFAGIRRKEQYYFLGPMSMKGMSRNELFRYYKSYGMRPEQPKQLKYFQFPEILDTVELISHILTEEIYEDEELVTSNHIIMDTKEQENEDKILFELRENEEEMYHHTYQEERKLLECVREGRVQDALQYNRSMDVDLGKLSKKEQNHWRNAAIVGITLCTRAAIEGGVSPSVAYRLSDFYIQKCDACEDVEQMLEYRNHAVEELTLRVSERLQKQRTSNYVECCKEYINRNYRKKIYLEDIAEALGISAGYLSRIFRAETHSRLQDYITQVRAERAANLLIYSEESIAGIAEYVNFPSQSYMGKVFKQYKNMTPREYREQWKPREFISK